MNMQKHNENMDYDRQIIKQAKILSEDGTVKFYFMTSLRKIAIAKVLTKLWMNQNTQQEIMNLCHSDMDSEDDLDEEWEQIEKNVVAKISELCLPNCISNMLKNTAAVFGHFVLDWIKFHDKYTFNTVKNSKYSAVDLISHITWTAGGRIDLAKTAKNILSSESCLSDDQKYKLACTYCLEDEIVALAPKVLNRYYLDNINIHKHPTLYFWTVWTRYVTGDFNKLHHYYRDYNHCNIDVVSIYECMLQILMLHKMEGNDLFIAYMWNKLNEQEKAKNVKSLIKHLGEEDLKYSLLSNLDYQQQQDVFKECSFSILRGILKDWLWEEYFLPVALHVLNIMDPKSYFCILCEIHDKMDWKCYEKNKDIYHQHKSLFQKLWQDGSRHLKDYIVNDEGNLSTLIIDTLSWERDLDIIDLIFKDVNNAEVKKNLIFSKAGIKICSVFIQNDEWHLLELLMKYTLSSEKNISEFKKKLISDKGNKIAFTYLLDEALDKIEHFMKWALKSEEEIDHFRQNLAFEGTLEIENNKIDFMKLENRFKWCAKDDLQLINRFKTEILKSYLGERLIYHLISTEQYELLEQMLNWCYLDNQHQIAQFKCNMYKKDFLGVNFFASLIEKDNSFKMLDKFTGYSFINEQQLQEFKMWILDPQETEETFYQSKSVCAKLLKYYQFQLADELINWCGISSETVSAFKNASMLSNGLLDIKEYADWDTKNVQLLIKWFNPSENTVNKMTAISEDKFRNGQIRKKNFINFLKLLDEFINNQNLISKELQRKKKKSFPV